MAQENQPSNWLIKLLGSAALVGTVTIIALIWSIYSTRSQELAMERQLANQATQITNQEIQIAKQDIQITLSSEQNRLLSEQITVAAQQADIDEQLRTPLPTNDAGFAPTATALAIQSSQIEATRQAIEERQRQIEATQTVVAEYPVSVCASNDYIPPISGIHPPVDRVICIPSQMVGWISSDAARITIPGIYDRLHEMGFTFVLFGPARVSLSNVASNNVWLDLRSNASLVGNYDNKSLNPVYQNGKVCSHAEYTGSGCP